MSLGLIFTAWSLLLIAWLTLHWGILPHIQQWREPIETRASAALGVPVKIGQIAVRSGGWVPSFELREVVLLDAKQQPALRLPRVFAAISPRSLLSLELRFEQLLIDGAQLEARRDPSGRIFVAGLDFSGPEVGNGSASSDWFFAQHEFVIRSGAIRWTDELRGAPPLELTDVQLVVRNGLRQHELRLDATPPAGWGDRFTATGRFSQPLLARRGDWRRWNGTVYADLPRADVRELRRHATLPFELGEGVGALRGWVDLKGGEPVAATIDLALRAVTLRLAPEVDPLAIEEVEGRLVAQRNEDGVTVSLQHFTFETGDNIRWPQGDMTLAWRQRVGEPATGGEFTAQRLDLALMAQVATRVPLGAPLRKLLAEANPRGLVADLSTTWEGPFDAPRRYRAKARVTGLALAAQPSDEPRGVGRPGLRGATVQLDATEAGGNARVTINGGALELPGVFEDPLLVLDQLSAQLLWKIEPTPVPGIAPKLTVQVREARFANADAGGDLTATWSTGVDNARGGRLPGRLELDAKLVNGVAARVHRYLPLGLPKSTRDYLAHAVQGGRIANASFRVRGDLGEFPFIDTKGAKDGEFRIAARIEDGTYAFIPSTPARGGAAAFESPWPALAKTSVDLVVDRGTLELRNGRTQIGNVDFPKVQATIRHLEADPVLSLDAAGRGPLGEMLRIVNTTPVGGWIGKALAGGTGTGAADLTLGLTIPLLRVDASTVKGSVGLAGNDVRITPDSPLLGAAKGRVDFTEKGVTVVGASARLYGGDATFDGGSQPDGTVRFNGQGTVNADGLRRAVELGAMARAAGALTGQASYRASLGFVRGHADINVTSNLIGLAINLPAPLAKAAETPLALRFAMTPEAGPPGQPAPRDTLRLDLGNLVQAQYLRDLTGDQPRVLRGGIGVLEPAPQPASGVAASINLPRLATDEWESAADRLFGAADARDAATPSAYVPDSIGLRVQELVAGPRRLTRVSAGLSQQAGVWRANVDAEQLNGYVEYRLPVRRAGAAAAGGRVYARLSRLSLPKGEDEQVESLLDQQAATMPALDVVVDDFELRGKKLGRVEIEAVNRAGGPGRDWQLSKFNITTPEAQLVATGHWSAAGPGGARGGAERRAVMDFKLQIADSGALLDRLGTKGAVRGGKGQLAGQIGWSGSPFALDYPSLTGQISVAVESGQFLKVDPGAARLLGVLSLQSLPRRLSLDFRDLFQEGFAFDSITGDVKIGLGVAVTNNLRMRGVQALVLMEGHADIERETQDLRVIVVPELNAGTAALAYAVINPAIGLGAFLAQALLKKPLTAASTREFHISGPWADPKVERVERKLGDDVPSADAPASAPEKK
ncbi:MAG: YhdP family protein [Pseudomonadota bacterium]